MAVHILDFCTFFNVQLLVLSLLFCLRLARRKLFWVRFTAICLPYLAIRCFVTLTEVARVGSGFQAALSCASSGSSCCCGTASDVAGSGLFLHHLRLHRAAPALLAEGPAEISFFPSGQELRYCAISFLMMAAVSALLLCLRPPV